MYYARREGYRNLGLQPLPTSTVAEHKAKEAIGMLHLLRSIRETRFATEQWTMADTSAELVLGTEPKHRFKKGGFQVQVWFDNNRDNAFPYTNWDHIYYQDDNDMWHKTPGKVDYNGLYFEEHNGDRVYFVLFASDADRYSRTGTWTVRYRNEIIYPPVTSSTRPDLLLTGDPETNAPRPSTSSYSTEEAGSSGSPRTQTLSETTGVRRGRRQRESSPDTPGRKRQRPDSTSSKEGPHETRRRGGGRGDGGRGGGEANAAPTPGQVGQRHQSVPKSGLRRLERLQEEARDPPIIILKGLANPLKCWRNRCNNKRGLFTTISTVFRWVQNGECGQFSNRLLVAFKDNTQRQLFLKHTTIPKGCSIAFGTLDSL